MQACCRPGSYFDNFSPRGYYIDMTKRGGRAYRQHVTFKEWIRARDNYQCQLCGCHVGETCDRHYALVSQLDVAHIIPWPLGSSTPENMRVLCHPCNKREDYGSQGVLAIHREKQDVAAFVRARIRRRMQRWRS